ncbi:embryonic polyadenylate-binding protein 2 [Rattus norvegicus]|uniref:Embryonic polyadenylate-binding protein 2 n=1 Tax=Rattus norvegicus TaxID=10116 RepID=EPAB2_RAT|nr:embryonic polyadenylate-binding protein 2 [Rattus norvegicus]B0BNE4.1 RecName: Full=Embryonic polyadenylate-binding protein 2; Short=Embryonic poly(A)-binding protein 2; Short=ePABP-2; Short=ePABP2; AltName: Full=Embryonic poly(A)-binding protein type II; AltName: Full=Poly(A)-binding protein nuclear-like 1 [Rattus norvegicus]AAI58790.1 Pabpnl1 protein [Rattus norvegicus]|eukprot:NP_001107251.1 embryonic polyadenylate-binding protein 2 [Rattus norvegicus]
MWPSLSNELFPPPTEVWLQTVSSDPEAQGWGAWGRTEKTSLVPSAGSDKEAEENEDSSFLLSLLEPENLAKSPVYNQELEAIRLKLWTMEHAEVLPEPPSVQRKATEEERAEARELLSPETIGCFFPGAPKENVEADHRSVYVGNVDYGGSAAELEAYFSPCGEIHRVTILCDKFSGHPKGYAYIEFASKSSVQAAVRLDESTFRGRVIKVLPKRTNFPGISSTDRGGLRTHSSSRAAFLQGSLQRKPRLRPHGQSRGRGRASPWFSPY